MIVVDTNILVYRWLPDPKNKSADTLIRIDPEWAAPLLWRSEFRNALAGYIRFGRLDASAAERAIDHAASSLVAGEHRVADRVVLELVTRSRCSAYDCEFVGLALALGTILVTEDKALLASFPRFCRSLDGVARRGIGPV